MHDPDLQPWASESSTGIDHYRRLVEFAVMNNHMPLVQVAIDHLQRKKKHLLKEVFNALCPGTDSSFLHIATALGHQLIVELLTSVCRVNFADGQGTSPVAVALLCGREAIAQRLLATAVNKLRFTGF